MLNNLKPILAQPCFPPISSEQYACSSESDFNSESELVRRLGSWLLNVLKYNSIYKQCRPLIDTMKSAQSEVEAKTFELAVVRQRVFEAKKKVSRVNEELSNAMVLNEKLQDVEVKLSLVESIFISLEHKSQNYEGEELITNN